MKTFTQLVLVLALLAGCGNTVDEDADANPPLTSGDCPAGTAQIAVQDGALSRVCGCNEASGVTIPAGGSFTCTVPTGTEVQFIYTGNQLRHQIVPTGSPQFPASPISRPERAPRITAHIVTLDQAGTYEFQDAYNSLLSGQIIAQ